MYLDYEVWRIGTFAIPKERILQKYRIGMEEMTVIEGVDASLIPHLNATPVKTDKLNDFLVEKGVSKFAIRGSFFYENTDAPFILFDDERFITPDEFELVEVFIEWDGRTQHFHERESNFLYDLTLTKQCVSLENHQIYKVFKKDQATVDKLYFVSKKATSRVLCGSLYTIQEIYDYFLPEQVLDIAQTFWRIGTLNGDVAPKLVGLSEFAEILGWSKPRLSGKYVRQQEGKKLRPPLPYPVQILSATPVWTLEQALHFKSLVHKR